MHSLLDGPYKFEDVKIVGADDARTTKDRQYPGLHHVHLRLSQRPPSEWVDVFLEQRSRTKESLERRARVEGEFLVLVCPLNEVERHLPRLKQEISAANARYRELSAKMVAAEASRRAADEAEQQEKRNTLGKLKFD
jgi:hypothetical protein